MTRNVDPNTIRPHYGNRQWLVIGNFGNLTSWDRFFD